MTVHIDLSLSLSEGHATPINLYTKNPVGTSHKTDIKLRQGVNYGY